MMKAMARQLLFLLMVWGMLSGSAWAERSWEEISREIEISEGNIRQAKETIARAEQTAQEAFTKVETAEHFEGPHWVALEKAMKEYGDTFKQQIKVIDTNVKNIIKLNPTANVPTVEFNPPMIKPSLKAMEAVRDDLKRAVLKAKKFKADRQQDRAKVVLEMEERTESQYADVALNLAGIPLNSDGSINYGDLVASLLPFPAQLINTGMTITFGLYFYADEMKSGVRQITTFKDMIAYADQAIERAEANVRSAEQGIQYLNGYWEQKDQLLKEFYQLRNGWVSTGDQAKQKVKQEETQEFQKELARPKVPAGNGYQPPMQPADVEPEANGVLQELQSAALAAMQGGDPDNYHGIMMSRVRDYRSKIDQASNAVKQAETASEQAYRGVLRTVEQANASFQAAIRGRCNCDPVVQAAAAAYDATVRSAYASMQPYYDANNRAYRERGRLYWIVSLISNGTFMLNRQMSEYAASTSSALFRAMNQGRRDFEASNGDLYALHRVLPDRYSLDGLKNYVASIDDTLQHDLSWGRDPSSLRSELLSTAESVRAMGESARRSVPEYKKTLVGVMQVAKQALNEANGIIDKDAMLLASHWDGSLSRMYWPSGDWDNWQRSGDDRKQRLADLKRNLEENFKIYEKTDLDYVQNFPYDSIARQIEDKAANLDSLIARLDTFRYRLSGVTGRLDAASRKLTKQGLYEARPKPAQTLADEELASGHWAALAAQAEAAVTPQTREAAKKYLPFMNAYGGVRGKLLAAQTALYTVAQVQMRNFIQARDQGWFAPVSPEDFKGLEAQWQRLSALYDQFDNQAASERKVLEQNPLPDIRPLQTAYDLIPANQKPGVEAPYRRFMGEYSYLNTYASRKLESLEPLGDTSRNNVKGYLETWIGGYPKALQEAKEAAERQQKESEERARRQEEENRKRSATELSGIQTLYQQFAAAYQRRDLRGITQLLSPYWRAVDGTDVADLENTLSNSFRVFDTVTFAISGLNIKPLGGSAYEVNYHVRLTGQMLRRNIKHEEQSDVTDVVEFTPDGPRIVRTSGGAFTIR